MGNRSINHEDLRAIVNGLRYFIHSSDISLNDFITINIRAVDLSSLFLQQFVGYIPKPLEDADSETLPNVRTRHNMKIMVIPFSNVVTQS